MPISDFVSLIATLIRDLLKGKRIIIFDKMASQLSIVIIVPVYNRLADLVQLMDSIMTIDNGEFTIQIVVIDDHSDVPIEMMDKWENHNVQIIRNETESKGPAWSRNKAVQETNSEYIWFLDSDSEILDPSILDNMLNIHLSNNRICATGGIIEDVQGRKMILEGKALINFLFVYDAFEPEQYQSKIVPGISATNFFIHRNNFLSVNGFDETLKRDEDADLCLRLKQKGFSFYQGNDTAVFHRLSDKGRTSAYSDCYKNRYGFIQALLETRLSIMAKHAPRRLIILPFLDFLTLFYLLIRLVKNRYYLKRIRLAGDSIRLSEIIPIIISFMKNYLMGWKLLVEENLWRNFLRKI